MTSSPEWSYLRALRKWRLSVLLFGVAVSSTGEGMLLVVLPLLALRVHGDVPAALAISFAAAAPYVLSTCLAMLVSLGRVRSPVKARIVADCLLRGLALSVLGVAAIGEQLGLTVLLISLLLGSALRSLSKSAVRLVATGIVPDEGRYAVNGLLATTNNVTLYVAGPVAGGLLTAATGPGWALLFSGSSFVVLLVVASAVLPRQAAARSDSVRPLSAVAVLKERPVVWRLLAIVFTFNLVYMPVEAALPLLVGALPGGGARALGIIWAGFGLGALVGAVATNYLRALPRRPLLIGVIVAWACTVLVLAVSTSVPTVTVTFACAGLCYAPFVPVAYSYVQSCLGRAEEQPVVTLWATISALAAPVGLAAAGPLVNALGARGGLVVSALTSIVLALVALRVLRPGEPDPSEPTVRATSPGNQAGR